MKVTIIIPIYNADKYLSRCLDSIVNQTVKDFEVLLIDDGSNDRSGIICDQYEKGHNYFKVIHKQNGGSGSARNIGIQIAKGEYITFVDADDHIHEKFCEQLITAIEQNNADIVQCGFSIIYKDHRKSENVSKEQMIYSNVDFLYKFCNKKDYLSIVVLWNKIYKKSLFDGLAFPIGKGVDDDYLICQIVYRATKIVQIPKCLYYYYMSDNSQMRSSPSLKRLDSIDAIHSQLNFFNSINEVKLYKLLLYRYYAAIIDGYYYTKKYFPHEKQVISELNYKRLQYRQVFWIKEVSLLNKVILVIRDKFPYLFEALHKEANF
jgi:glycosyltransferase involved in cell wall biosynthesis